MAIGTTSMERLQVYGDGIDSRRLQVSVTSSIFSKYLLQFGESLWPRTDEGTHSLTWFLTCGLIRQKNLSIIAQSAKAGGTQNADDD
jgi:hypothetical protein